MQSIAQLDNTTLQAMCCAGLLNDATQCAICPNPDLAGIGVRVAFYLQCLVNTLLIAFSPSDSVPTAWAGTLLSLALVIASFVSKKGGNLTLHHATLVLNFVTLSTISSLAVAPMLPIWRLSPEEFYERHRRRHALLYTDQDDPRYVHDVSVLNASLEANTRKLRIKKAQRRQRVIISVVLLLQVVLQWAWGISLFVDPQYSQDYLNNSTRLILFLAPFETGSINGTAKHPHAGGFLLWASWILFCLCLTMALVVNLAISGSSHSQTSLSSVRTGLDTGHTSYTSGTPIGKQWERMIRESVFLMITRQQAMEVLRVSLVIVLWALFIAASEWQRAGNRIFGGEEGEENFGSLGQITAISVSLAPLWSLIVALTKYPALRRKQRRFLASHRRDEEARVQHNGAHEEDETGHLLRTSLTISPLAAHTPLPSDETLMETSNSIEMHHLAPLCDALELNYHCSEVANLPNPSSGTPSNNCHGLLSPLPMSTTESHPHNRALLYLPPFSSNSSSSDSGNISDGGSGASSSGVAGTSSNGRPVQRPRGPRASVSLSPSEWGTRNSRTNGSSSPISG